MDLHQFVRLKQEAAAEGTVKGGRDKEILPRAATHGVNRDDRSSPDHHELQDSEGEVPMDHSFSESACAVPCCLRLSH